MDPPIIMFFLYLALIYGLVSTITQHVASIISPKCEVLPPQLHHWFGLTDFSSIRSIPWTPWTCNGTTTYLSFDADGHFFLEREPFMCRDFNATNGWIRLQPKSPRSYIRDVQIWYDNANELERVTYARFQDKGYVTYELSDVYPGKKCTVILRI